METGDVEGVLDEGLAVYKAIPYAAPPVGNLRWRAPQPAKSWQGVRKCDTFGPLPPQPTTMQFSNGASLIMRPNREQVDFVDRYYRAKRQETESSRK